MRNIWTRFENARVAFVASLVKFKDRQPPHITLSMIGTELESDLTDLQSRFAKATIRGYGIQASWPFISRR